MSERLKGYIFILLGTFFVGGVAVSSKLALNHMSVTWFLAWMYLIGTVLTIPVGAKLQFLKGRQEWSYFFLHVFGIVGGWYLSIHGLKYLTAPTAAFVSRFEFPLVMIISMFFLKEVLGRIIYLSIALSIAGVMVMAEEGVLRDIMAGVEGKNWGIFLVATAAFGFALGELGTKFIAGKIDSRVFTFLRNLPITVFVFSVALYLEGWKVPSKEGLFYAAICALCGPVLARIFYMESLKRIHLGHATVFTQLEPIHALFFAFCLGMELPAGREYLGGGLILLSCLVLVLSQYRRGPDKVAILG